MCVIMVAGKVRPTDEMIRKAWDHNKDGGGAAWREEGANGEIEVVWKKGIENVDEMLDLLHNIPLPFVAHFRIGTVGGKKSTLTHPFLVDRGAGTDLEGRTKGAVLFHNGHWNDWSEKALDAAISSNRKIPVGDWSDTRAMAWMVDIYGFGFMELMTTQKGVLWTPNDMRVFTGRDGWEEINNVWCSNDNFWTRKRHTTSYTSRPCKTVTCQKYVWGNDEYCWDCKSKQNTKLIEGKTADDKEDHTAGTNGNTKKEASTALVAITGVANPLVQFLTLQEAEDLHRKGGMSKSKIKNYRKLYKKLGQGGNQEERAVKKMIYISNIVAKDLLHGSVH